MHLIIGTYTERLPHVDGKADGILTASFDAASGRFGEVRTLAALRNPSYLTVSPAGDRVYAVSETAAFEGRDGGGLVAFVRDPRTGDLTRLHARPTVGDSPCHVALVRDGRLAVTANYGEDGGSVSVHPVGTDGGLGDLADHVEHAGSGPHAERQASSHAHMTVSDPETGHILVTDLGADSIFEYETGPDGRLTPVRELKTRPGDGPRHLAFHPDGRHLFAVNELGSTVTVWRRGPDGFEAKTTTSTLPAGAGAENLPAAIRVSPSGRHVLVSNRGHDSIAVFRFDPAAPGLELLSAASAEGECPRDFILTPDGSRLVAACQDSGVLTSYEFDDDAGTLRPLNRAVAATPVCLALALQVSPADLDRDVFPFKIQSPRALPPVVVNRKSIRSRAWRCRARLEGDV